MKKTKKVFALLSSSLLLGSIVMSPVAGWTEKVEAKEAETRVDWSLVNENALIQHLKEKGKLDQDASPEEINQAVKEYVMDGSVPFSQTEGIDTSSKFGEEAYKGKKKIQQKVFDKISKIDENTVQALKENKKSFNDRAVVALIEFPDFPHNSIKKKENQFWVKDFNPEHYEQLLFNRDGFTMDNGEKIPSLRQFYLEQSVGYWNVVGEVTPWVQAKHEAKYYGGHQDQGDYELKDARPRELVMETLAAVGQQIAGKEELYDQRDPYDLDNDGDVMEPDGLLDNLFIVHSGEGEEAGGGDLGEDAIWSHRSVIGPEPVPIPGTNLKAFDYIIQPEDGAAGVFAHEYGHNLGLPDEYDTGYTGAGSPIEAWSLMSYGSWTGKIPGTEPTGFSPWAKLYFQETYGGTWPIATVIDYDRLHQKRAAVLKEAVAQSSKGKILKINLPDQLVDPPTQPRGKKSYFSDKGNMLNTKLTSAEIDLTHASEAKLQFESWRQIEAGYDFLYVNVYADGKKETIRQYDDDTNGKWVEEELDLTPYTGKKIKIEFNYVTDIGLMMEGFYVDNIAVTADGKMVFSDDAEGDPKFTLDGFKVFDGSKIPFEQYYLVEWRTHHGMDLALKHLRRGQTMLSYDPGMVVWFYDARWGEDNMTGLHPGEGFLGVVDAHQRGHYWNDGTVADTRYQINDAAFGFKKTSPIDIEFNGSYMKYDPLPGIHTFYDGHDYTSPFNPDGGKILPHYGIGIALKKVKNGEKEVIVEVSKK
ncbi:immune inhibitor A domain-containing protein [Thermoactinomyces sp. CICC 10735]|uniref:immune inhibitor A domain-containing protein n=1 Tax=Thermoactinomyces sp. CICC 10735 TaxID=2767430 RepID=UPI0018DD228E|nr:immune inhibitor A domain-containing protein [Thermoactinomyces sp. CICC 10735]MBH8582248.1 immune inhibitor A [Thermoactinomyces sp. CICC 10735]